MAPIVIVPVLVHIGTVAFITNDADGTNPMSPESVDILSILSIYLFIYYAIRLTNTDAPWIIISSPPVVPNLKSIS